MLSWGDERAPKLFLLHGWMDVAASFQFLVDALTARFPRARARPARASGEARGNRRVTGSPTTSPISMRCSRGSRPASACGSAATALARTSSCTTPACVADRVETLIALDGFGIPAESPERAPDKLAAWLDALADPPSFAPYDELRSRCCAVEEERRTPDAPTRRHSSRATGPREARTARCASRRIRGTSSRSRSSTGSRKCSPSGDASRRARFGSPPRIRTFPRGSTGHPEGEAATDSLAGVRRRMANVRGATLVTIPDAGHMLHHDQPQAVARAHRSFHPMSRRSNGRCSEQDELAARHRDASRRLRRARRAHADMGQQLDRDEVRADARASRFSTTSSAPGSRSRRCSP